jgi:hypothetical protein
LPYARARENMERGCVVFDQPQHAMRSWLIILVPSTDFVHFSSFVRTNSGKYFIDTAPGSNTASW